MRYKATAKAQTADSVAIAGNAHASELAVAGLIGAFAEFMVSGGNKTSPLRRRRYGWEPGIERDTTPFGQALLRTAPAMIDIRMDLCRKLPIPLSQSENLWLSVLGGAKSGRS